MNRAHLVVAEIGLSVLAAPMLLWLGLYSAFRWWSLSLRPILPFLRVARYAVWSIGAILFFIHFVLDDFSSSYGIAVVTSSIELGVLESWVKEQFAPELLEASSPHGYWPSKRE